MKRRAFMKAAAAGGLLAGGASLWSRNAKATFGEVPAQYQSLLLPQNRRASNILEIFLYGGVSSYETFYAHPTYGTNSNSWLDAKGSQGQSFRTRTIDAATVCGYQPDPDNLLTFFSKDSDGKDIFFGPFLKPLLDRPDVLNRTRVVINRHTLEPHEAAIPFAISGKTLGSPSLAALGAHVQQAFVEADTTGRTTPYSYGFATAGGFIPNDNVLSVVATGLHPGSARPLLIKVDNASRLNQLLSRTSVGGDSRAAYDALMQVYFEEYEAQLHYNVTGDAVRAAKFRELYQANRSVVGAQAVQDVLDPALFERLPGAACGETNTINVPAMSLNLAVHLLTHPQNPAKHCCVVDTGLREADGGGGYDTHSEMSFTQSRNLNNILTNLLSHIKDPANPTPDDDKKIDLSKTMIILNQEFGRAPISQNNGNGRNHWPYGYAQVYIGGPITTEQKGIYGSLAESAQATTFTTPTENRIAALLAMGIWPFDSTAFSNSDVQNQSTDTGAIRSATKRILGYDV